VRLFARRALRRSGRFGDDLVTMGGARLERATSCW
jgi:hypothetical protein